MAYSRNSTLIKNELIRYISSIGIVINTVTKARGNNGFFKGNRIDISKKLDDDSALRVILHEFAHSVHYNLDKTLSDIRVLFNEDTCVIKEELRNVTNFVDDNALCSKLIKYKDDTTDKIKDLSAKIKLKYPNFVLSETLDEFKKYARFSDIAYLEKYDRVKLKRVGTTKIISIATVKNDFPDITDECIYYLQLKSAQRKRSKISKRINKCKKYYDSPSELFARFVEGLYLDIEKVKSVAPTCYDNFCEMYNKNYYKGLNEIFSIVRIVI